jgi:hypothetical protein
MSDRFFDELEKKDYMDSLMATRIEKLELKDNDIIVLSPSNEEQWRPEECIRIRDMFDEILRSIGYKNVCILFQKEVDLKIITKGEVNELQNND